MEMNLHLKKLIKMEKSMNKQLLEFQNEWTPIINKALANNVVKNSDQKTLGESMAYSVDAGGKRLRPLLTLATLKSLGIEIDDVDLLPILSIELIHTYSLIHDDLPAMDNDDLRRGKPTNHMVFGSGMATLAGDGLQTLAFQWLVNNNLPINDQVKLVKALAQAAGPKGMVAGQAIDIFNEGKTKLDFKQLQTLHRRKTGDLIHYSVLAGIIIGHGDELKKELLKFADSFGLAFQIYDDILDVVGDKASLGKPVNQDQDKNTYTNLLGLAGAQKKLMETIKMGKKSLDKISQQIDISLLNSFFTYFELNIED